MPSTALEENRESLEALFAKKEMPEF